MATVTKKVVTIEANVIELSDDELYMVQRALDALYNTCRLAEEESVNALRMSLFMSPDED